MRVMVKLEEGLAEVIVKPTTAKQKALLAFVRSYGYSTAMVKMGADDEMCFVLQASNDAEKYAEITEKFDTSQVP
jgi:hypothetical protein